MDRKTRKNNVIAFWLAVISSLFLFISGTTGAADWVKIEDAVLKYANFGFISNLFILVLIVASFGGIAVLIGGISILKGKVFWGDLLISLGSGAAIIGFFFNLFILIITSNFSMYSYLSFSSLGVIFAVSAQIFSNTKKNIKWYRRFI
jgi:cation transport ATPase